MRTSVRATLFVLITIVLVLVDCHRAPPQSLASSPAQQPVNQDSIARNRRAELVITAGDLVVGAR